MTLQRLLSRAAVVVGGVVLLACIVAGLLVLFIFFEGPRRGSTNREHAVCLIPDSSSVRTLIAGRRTVESLEDDPIEERVRKIQEKMPLHWKRGENAPDEYAKLRELYCQWDSHIDKRLAFIRAMETHPCITISPGSDGRFLDERTGAGCSTSLKELSSRYVKVKIISGPQKGKIGWLCEPRDMAHNALAP